MSDFKFRLNELVTTVALIEETRARWNLNLDGGDLPYLSALHIVARMTDECSAGVQRSYRCSINGDPTLRILHEDQLRPYSELVELWIECRQRLSASREAKTFPERSLRHDSGG